MTRKTKIQGLVIVILILDAIIGRKVADWSYAKAFAEAQRISKLPIKSIEHRFIAKNATVQYVYSPSYYTDSANAKVGYHKFVELCKTSDVIIYTEGCNEFGDHKERSAGWYAVCNHGGFQYSYHWEFKPPKDYKVESGVFYYSQTTGEVIATWDRKRPAHPSYLFEVTKWNALALLIWGIAYSLFATYVDLYRVDAKSAKEEKQ